MRETLRGRRILVTRAQPQAEELAELLRDRGAEPISVPVMRLVPLLSPGQFRALAEEIASGCWDDVVFTSANAVGLVLPTLPSGPAPARIYAIGPGTARAVAALGWSVEPLPETFVAESLAQSLLSAGVSGRRVLLARAAGAREVLPAALERAGAQLKVVEIYEMEPEEDSRPALNRALADPTLDCVVFASGSSVDCFRALSGATPLADSVLVACIGPITAQTARAAAMEPGVIAHDHSLPGLVRALELHLGPLPENGHQP